MGDYADVIIRVFDENFSEGDQEVVFSMDDLRNACDELEITIRNPPDIIAHFRSRNDLPREILSHGNWVLESTRRGEYRLLRISSNPYYDIDFEDYPEITLDIDEDILRYIGNDEQAYISLMHHSGALARFLQIDNSHLKHLQNHFKTNVDQVQMEADDFNLAIISGDYVLVGIEAKGASPVERLNRVQQQQIRLLISSLFPDEQRRILGLKGIGNRSFAIVEFSDEGIDQMEPINGVRVLLRPVQVNLEDFSG